MKLSWHNYTYCLSIYMLGLRKTNKTLAMIASALAQILNWHLTNNKM